ncbi:hypothetical protein [Paraliobacillus ryukyuensis]|uniref:hypothetical protein n=1 Tax=Paraliobacillus ryukyuensis TaxID=200904 RepID=UPI0015C4C75A|nr:hypothetical protein [Paraliobacillus ryukyuensis]
MAAVASDDQDIIVITIPAVEKNANIMAAAVAAATDVIRFMGQTVIVNVGVSVVAVK